MNRADLQSLATMRIAEANALLAAGHPSGAYYLAGYAVECAFKAVIAKQTQLHDFPDKQRALESFVHDPGRLAQAARLDKLLRAHIANNPAFGFNWDTVSAWSEATRYASWAPANAQGMIAAVEDSDSGVLPWIIQYW